MPVGTTKAKSTHVKAAPVPQAGPAAPAVAPGGAATIKDALPKAGPVDGFVVAAGAAEVGSLAVGPKGTAAPGNNFGVMLAARSAKASGPRIPTSLPVHALTKVDCHGAAGAVFLLDATRVQGQRVNLRHISHPTLGNGVELNLKLRSPQDIALVMTALAKDGKDGAFELQPMEEKDGRLIIAAPQTYVGGSAGAAVPAGAGVQLEGTCRTLKGDGFQVDVMQDASVPQALRGKVRIRVFGSSDAELGQRLEAVLADSGLKEALAPSDAVARGQLDRMRLLWQAAPQEAQSLFEKMGAMDTRAADALLQSHHVPASVVAGTVRKEVFPGHVTTLNPAQGEEYKRLGVQYVFAGVGTLEGALGILKSSGIMSSEERMTRGLLVAGISTWDDYRTGGADYVFTRMATKDAAGEDLANAPFAGEYQVAFKPEVLSRTDWFAYPSDNYGNTKDAAVFGARLYGQKLVKALGEQNGYATSNEVMFQRGISNADLLSVFTQSEPRREALLAALKAHGITMLAGRPVEDVVVVRTAMVDLTQDVMVHRFHTLLASQCLTVTPEVDAFLRTAAAQPGFLPALEPKLQNILGMDAAAALSELATLAGLAAPALVLDSSAFLERARGQLRMAGIQDSPEMDGFFSSLATSTVPPAVVLTTLQELAYGDARTVLEGLATQAGLTVPPFKADPAAMVQAFQAVSASACVVFTPELETFIRQLAEKGVQPQALKDAATGLAGDQQVAVLAQLAAQQGLQAPALSVDVPAVAAAWRTSLVDSGSLWSDALETFVKDAAAKSTGPYPLLAMAGSSFGYGCNAQAGLDTLAGSLGLVAPRLAADVPKVTANLRTALESTGMTWTPELDTLVAKAAENGASAAQVQAAASNIWNGAAALKELAALAGLPLPKLAMDVDRVVAPYLPSLAVVHVPAGPELKQFLQDLLDHGQSVLAVGQMLASMSYAGVQAQLDALAARAGIPAPTNLVDLAAVQADAKAAFAGAGLVYSAEMEQFFNVLGQAGYAYQCTAPTLHTSDENGFLQALAGMANTTAPKALMEPAAAAAQWGPLVEGAGFKFTPELHAWLLAANKAGQPNATIRYFLAQLPQTPDVLVGLGTAAQLPAAPPTLVKL